MVKVIDLDNLFEEYISDYVYKNIGKVKPEEIENNMPILYAKFGKEPCAKLDDKSPEEYYDAFSISELLSCLKEHLNKGISVPDFLCESITKKKGEDKAIYDQLLVDNDEEYTVYLMNMLHDLGGNVPLKRYLEMVLYSESPVLAEVATEMLFEFANEVKEDIFEAYKNAPIDRLSYLTEIISYVKNDDRAFDIIIAEFCKNQNRIPEFCQYISRLGDERALPFLMKAIEDEKISYADFEELRFCIESLGGEYTKKRDFSADKFYKKITESRRK